MSDNNSGAAIAALGNVSAAAINSSGAKKSQARANKFNIAQWERNNEYNSPSSQMARLQSAGLNPNLIYGAGGSTAVGNSNGPPAPSKATPHSFQNPFANITQFADIRQKGATTDNLKAQNTVIEQEAILKGAQTAKIGVETAKNKFDLGLAEELKNTSLQAASENLRSMEATTIGKQLDNSFKDKALRDRVRTLFYDAEYARENLGGKQLDNRLKQLEIDLTQMGIQKNDPWYFRILGRQKSNIQSGIRQIIRK